jgi:hypothetical protein
MGVTGPASSVAIPATAAFPPATQAPSPPAAQDPPSGAAPLTVAGATVPRRAPEEAPAGRSSRASEPPAGRVSPTSEPPPPSGGEPSEGGLDGLAAALSRDDEPEGPIPLVRSAAVPYGSLETPVESMPPTRQETPVAKRSEVPAPPSTSEETPLAKRREPGARDEASLAAAAPEPEPESVMPPTAVLPREEAPAPASLPEAPTTRHETPLAKQLSANVQPPAPSSSERVDQAPSSSTGAVLASSAAALASLRISELPSPPAPQAHEPAPEPAPEPPAPHQRTIAKTMPSSTTMTAAVAAAEAQVGGHEDPEAPLQLVSPRLAAHGTEDENNISSSFFAQSEKDLGPPAAFHDLDEREPLDPETERYRQSRRKQLSSVVLGALGLAVLVGAVGVVSRGMRTEEPVPVATSARPTQRPTPPATTSAPAATTAAPTTTAPIATAPATTAEPPPSATTPPSASAAPSAEAPVELDPKKAKEFQLKSLQMLERGKYDDSIAFAQQAVSLDPTEANPYLYWGTALMSQNKRAQAKEIFTRCVETAKHGPVHECRQFR